jgi:HEAT repeat protein
MRRAALMGLGIARRPESVPLLRNAVIAVDAPTRLIAVSALAEYDLPEVVPVLAHAASDPDESVRSAAIGFLSTRTGSDATKALLDQLLNPEARQRVIAALAVAPEERIEGVLSALEAAGADLTNALVAALVRMQRPSSQAALAEVLAYDNVWARRAAASALASLDTVEAREALARVGTTDPDLEVRRICATAARFR